jgi:hypothetical protein
VRRAGRLDCEHVTHQVNGRTCASNRKGRLSRPLLIGNEGVQRPCQAAGIH